MTFTAKQRLAAMELQRPYDCYWSRRALAAEKALEENKPWPQVRREILAGIFRATTKEERAAVFDTHFPALRSSRPLRLCVEKIPSGELLHLNPKLITKL